MLFLFTIAYSRSPSMNLSVVSLRSVRVTHSRFSEQRRSFVNRRFQISGKPAAAFSKASRPTDTRARAWLCCRVQLKRELRPQEHQPREEAWSQSRADCQMIMVRHLSCTFVISLLPKACSSEKVPKLVAKVAGIVLALDQIKGSSLGLG